MPLSLPRGPTISTPGAGSRNRSRPGYGTASRTASAARTARLEGRRHRPRATTIRTGPAAGPVCAPVIVAQGSRAQIDKIAAGPMYSAVAAAEHGEVAKMPAELVENEGQRECDGPGADGRCGARLAGIRKGSPAVDRVREIPCPAPPRSPGVPPTAGSASRTRQQTRESPGERRLRSGMVVAPGTDPQTKEVPPWT